MEILLVDDERVLRKALSARLRQAGYEVRTAADGFRALAAYRNKRPDLLLLDVLMPRLDGLAVCREIRRVDGDLPILFLTALSAEEDELRGLGLGADDYLGKDVAEDVLLARVAAAFRRTCRSADPSCDFAVGSVVVNPLALTLRDGTRSARLSEREVALLRHFATHPGEVVSFDFLLTRFWNSRTDDVQASALVMQIKRLREKLGSAGCRLTNVRGVGYVWQPNE